MKTEPTLDQVNQIIKTTKHKITETRANLLEPDQGLFCLACDDTFQAQSFGRHPSFDRAPLDRDFFDSNGNQAPTPSEARLLTSPYYCWYPLSATAGPISA